MYLRNVKTKTTMKYQTIISTLLYVLGGIMLQACHSQPRYNHRLVEVDSIMWQHPDSALKLLEAFPTSQLFTEADRAYFSLLLTQAKDKNYILQTEDSHLLKSISFFDTHDRIRKGGRAHYYLGCIYRDRLRPVQSLEEFLIAVPLLEQAKDYRLLGRTYNNMAYLYYLEEVYDKADSLYKKAEQIAVSVQDKMLQAEAVVRQGYILMFSDRYNYINSEKMFTKAWQLIEEEDSPTLKADIALGLSLLYGQMKETGKAILFANNAKKLQIGYMSDFALGEAFFHAHQVDSAEKYFSNVLNLSDFDMKSQVYLRLANIAKTKGQFEEASRLEQSSYSLNASNTVGTNKAELEQAEKNVLLKQLPNSPASFNNSFFIIMLIFVVLICFYILYTLLARQRKNHSIADQQQVIEAEVQRLHATRQILQKEASSRSGVMLKINRILQDFKRFGESKEQLTEEDWQQFILETDKQWNNITLKLQTNYQLTKEEIRICCLYLTEIPSSHFGELMLTSRDTTYKRVKRIMGQRLKITEKNNFREVLRQMASFIVLLLPILPICAQKLNNYAYTNDRNVEILLHIDEDMAEEEQTIYLFSFCPWISGNEAAIWDSIQTRKGQHLVTLKGYTTAENSFELLFSKIGPTSFRFYAIPNDTIEFSFSYKDSYISPEFKEAIRGETHNDILPLRKEQERILVKLRDKDPYITKKNFSNDSKLLRFYIHHLHETIHPSLAYNFYNSLRTIYMDKLSEDSIKAMRQFIADKFPLHPQCTLNRNNSKQTSQGNAAWRRRNEIVLEQWGYEKRNQNSFMKRRQKVFSR